MRVLATRLGCSVGTLTYHFKTKQDLLDQMFAHYAGAQQERFEGLEYGAGFIDDVLSRLSDLLPLSSEKDKVWRIYLAYWAHALPAEPGAGSVVGEVLKDAYAFAAGIFAAAQEHSHIDPDQDPAGLGRQLANLMAGSAFCMLQSPLGERDRYLVDIREFLERLSVK